MACLVVCTICSENYKSTDEVLCTSCRHVFHRSCFQKWNERSKTCPHCRSVSSRAFRIFLNFEEPTEAERQLHQSKKQLITKISQLQSKLSTSETNLLDVLKTLSSNEEQLISFNIEVKLRESQIEQLKKEIQTKETKILDSERAQKEQVEAEIKLRNDQTEYYKSEIERFKQQKIDSELLLNINITSSDMIRKLNKRIEQLDGELQIKNVSLFNAEQKLRAYEQQINKLNNGTESNKANLLNMMRQLNAKKKQFKALSDDIKLSETQIGNYEKEIKRFKGPLSPDIQENKMQEELNNIADEFNDGSVGNSKDAAGNSEVLCYEPQKKRLKKK